jgi:hypothetical protein
VRRIGIGSSLHQGMAKSFGSMYLTKVYPASN